MSCTASAPRFPIRIYRPQEGLRCVPGFQDEWAPVDDPFAEDSAAHGWTRPERPMPSRSYFDVAQSIALSASVSAFVTLVLTVRAIGLAPHWTETWLTTLQLSLLIGLPARFLIEPYVARAVGWFVEPPIENKPGPI